MARSRTCLPIGAAVGDSELACDSNAELADTVVWRCDQRGGAWHCIAMASVRTFISNPFACVCIPHAAAQRPALLAIRTAEQQNLSNHLQSATPLIARMCRCGSRPPSMPACTQAQLRWNGTEGIPTSQRPKWRESRAKTRPHLAPLFDECQRMPPPAAPWPMHC